MTEEFTDAELESFLDETLDGERAIQIEQALRRDETSDNTLLQRLSQINGRRDAGLHSLGEIWRRNQIGVPSRQDMGNHLLGVLEDAHSDYIQFRLEVLKCPFTIAMKKDLVNQHEESAEVSQKRRRKIYDSSSGYLPKRGQ